MTEGQTQWEYCDWGGYDYDRMCRARAIALRYDQIGHSWVPVCTEHSGHDTAEELRPLHPASDRGAGSGS